MTDPADISPAEADPMLSLDCFTLSSAPPRLVASSPLRAWMEEFADKHAYRCLPLTMANTFGWELLCPYDLAIDWTGGSKKCDLQVRNLELSEPAQPIARSHFSGGIVTFHTDYIFRTPPQWHLLATGPVNNPKRGVSALTGIIESDWLPYPFTMNWAMTEAGTVIFERDEPFCLLYPVQAQISMSFIPRIHSVDDFTELKQDFTQFCQDRAAFLARFEQSDPSALAQGWQRRYFLGQHPDGRRAPRHLNKWRALTPLDCRKATP